MQLVNNFSSYTEETPIDKTPNNKTPNDKTPNDITNKETFATKFLLTFYAIQKMF